MFKDKQREFETLQGFISYEGYNNKPRVATFARSVFINTDPRIKEFQNGQKVLEFLTNIQGEYSKDALERYGKGQLNQTEYGVTAQITIDITHPNREKYLRRILKKGARIDSAMIDFAINQGANGGSFLNGRLTGFGQVIDPEPKPDPAGYAAQQEMTQEPAEVDETPAPIVDNSFNLGF